MHGLIHFLGFIAVVLLIIYGILGLLYMSRKQELEKIEARVGLEGMPVMRPIPISTSSHSGLDQILAFVFLVRRWRVEQAFTLEFRGTKYLIPAGFEFDGASIPRPLWAILSPIGLLLIPGLIHDFGYRYNSIYTLNDKGEAELTVQNKDQAFWDDMFCEIGKQVNGIELLNVIATFGLKLGGHKTWSDWRDKNHPTPPFSWTLDDVSEPEAEDESTEQPSEVPVKTSVKEEEGFQSGTTKTTEIGYINSNQQKVHGHRNTQGSEKNQHAYKVECLNCGHIYGSNGSELYRRKCPACQQGKPEIGY